MMTLRTIGIMILAVFLAGIPLSNGAEAQDRKPPYWASLRFDEVRMRVGPSREYPIEWVYRRKGLPVKVIRSREGWRLVQDPDGTQGWVAGSQLLRKRAALVVGEGLVIMRDQPITNGGVRWRAEPGVVATLLGCREAWCEIDVTGRTGWVEADRLWGDEELTASE